MRHRIAAVTFSEHVVDCGCGWSASAPDDDGLAERYQEHRVEQGLGRKSMSGYASHPLSLGASSEWRATQQAEASARYRAKRRAAT